MSYSSRCITSASMNGEGKALYLGSDPIKFCGGGGSEPVYKDSLIAAWKAYGKSNGDADPTVWNDYSGNGLVMNLQGYFSGNYGWSPEGHKGALFTPDNGTVGKAVFSGAQFSLDDYTVIAIREMLTTGFAPCILAKMNAESSIYNPFVFEDGGSFGNNNAGVDRNTALPQPGSVAFSWQSKNSLNGVALANGVVRDTADGVFVLFASDAEMFSRSRAYALYDIRVYNRTLSSEELEMVKNDMYQEYVKYSDKPLSNYE